CQIGALILHTRSIVRRLVSSIKDIASHKGKYLYTISTFFATSDSRDLGEGPSHRGVAHATPMASGSSSGSGVRMRIRKPRTKLRREQHHRLLDVIAKIQYMDLREWSKLSAEFELTQTRVYPGLLSRWYRGYGRSSDRSIVGLTKCPRNNLDGERGV
uniref:Homeobox domain-containing protein n=1 Tax=Mesocestoides corti TaxID=53468 RepID=A0A5K3FX97_MESCO